MGMAWCCQYGEDADPSYLFGVAIMALTKSVLWDQFDHYELYYLSNSLITISHLKQWRLESLSGDFQEFFDVFCFFSESSARAKL